MTEEIAQLVLEHGKDIFPYLDMRAKFSSHQDILVSDYTTEEIEMLEVSGFIKVQENNILLHEGDRWLYSPKKVVRKRKDNQPYVPKNIENLAKIVGYPADWHNIRKYMKMYADLTRDYPEEKVIEVANWVKENRPDLDLFNLLIKSWFRGFLHNMENPKQKTQFKDRVEDEEYTAEGFF